MSRLPYIQREQLEPESQAIWDEIGEGRRVPPLAQILMYQPEMAAISQRLGRFLREGSSITKHQSELIVLVVARESDCLREWAAHLNGARRAGVSEKTIEVIKSRGPLDEVDDADDRAFIAYGRELLCGRRASESTFQAVRKIMGDVGIVEVTELIGYYSMVATVLNAFEVEPPEDPALLLPV